VLYGIMLSMVSEDRKCQNCNDNFTIDLDDFSFYEKIGVPAPTFCPKCRMIRRMAWRNDMVFHRRTCEHCSKKVISVHAENNGMRIFCNACWWSDDWDSYEYGRDYDFSRPFFEQYNELMREVPVLALMNDNRITSTNCEYTSDCFYSKDCYMTFVVWKQDGVSYSRYGMNSTDCGDCSSVMGGNELVYEGIFVRDCYDCRYIESCTGLTSSSFCYDCRGCSDCFMCIGLRQQQYCFKNEQFTKEHYFKKIEEYQLSTYSGVQRATLDFSEFQHQFPRRANYLVNCVASTGHELANSKNMKECYNIADGENCAYSMHADSPKDSYDFLVAGECEQAYESLTPDNSYRSLGTIFSNKSSYSRYTLHCPTSNNIFGSVSVRKGEYIILNKRYTKEEYEELLPEIIKHMKETGEYGEFMPAQMSFFGYNETMAQEVMPLTKDQAIEKGYNWQGDLVKPLGSTTLPVIDIPNDIIDVSDSVVDEVLECAECKRNYRIVQQELKLYRRMRIPIPRKCFQCRIDRRINVRSLGRLLFRNCGKCEAEVRTPYQKEHVATVWCNDCYKKGFD